MSRAFRFPFSFRQTVRHEAFPGTDFNVLAMEADHTGEWTVSVTDPGGGGFWRFPAGELTYADLAEEQAAMAEWMGCPVERMNAHHDSLHRWLAERAGVQSYSLAQYAGKALSPTENAVAAAEEEAVLHVQRYLCVIENLPVKGEPLTIEGAHPCTP